MNDDALAERSGGYGRCHQYGVTTVKEGCFQRTHTRAPGAGTAQHGHVVDASQAAERAVLDGGAAAPAKACAAALACGMCGRETMERLAAAARAVELDPELHG